MWLSVGSSCMLQPGLKRKCVEQQISCMCDKEELSRPLSPSETIRFDLNSRCSWLDRHASVMPSQRLIGD
jgi:hypothetical protein